VAELIAGETKTHELARFCSGLRISEIPEDVRHHARRALVDWLAAVLTGLNEPAARKLRQVITTVAHSGAARIAGSNQLTTAPFAALANGYMSHLNDFDDVFNPEQTTVHLGSCLWPTIFAMADLHPISGQAAIESFVAGFEAGARFACAAGREHFESPWQVTGTAGRIATAAAAARALSLSAEATTNALGIGASQAGGLREVYGTDNKALQPAKAAMDGVLAGLLAERGFSSSDTALEGQRGLLRAVSPSPDPEQLVSGLGTTWRLLENGHKLYPSASLTHPVIDAAASLARKTFISLGDVRHVTATMHPFAADVTATRHPDSPTAARFSAAHCIAVAILRGSVTLADFTPESISHPSVRQLRDKVQLVPDGACSKRSARVQIELMNGTSIEEVVDQNRGTPANPLTDKELEEKLCIIAEMPPGSSTASDILSLCWHLDSSADIRIYLSRLSELYAARVPVPRTR
jgi:2-methylcitrate dehydratase PrpD